MFHILGATRKNDLERGITDMLRRRENGIRKWLVKTEKQFAVKIKEKQKMRIR